MYNVKKSDIIMKIERIADVKINGAAGGIRKRYKNIKIVIKVIIMKNEELREKLLCYGGINLSSGILKSGTAKYFALLTAVFIIFVIMCQIFIISPASARQNNESGGESGAREHAIVEIKDARTTEVCVLAIGAGTSSVALGSQDSPAFASNGPSSFAADKDENLYILDALNFRVLKISKNGSVAAVFNYPKGETDNMRDWYYMSDIAISPENGNIYLLNQTLKSVFILSPAGEMRAAIDLKLQCDMPQKLSVSASGEIFVSDPAGPGVIVYNGGGAVTGRVSDDTAGVYGDKTGFIFAFGEFDKEGRDILLLDGASKRRAKIFSKLIKSIKETEPYDYQILGQDLNYNFYASIIEKIAEDVIQTLIYKIDENGKAVQRIRLFPLRHIGDTSPTRYFCVSPNGVIYGVTSSADYSKYVIARIE